VNSEVREVRAQRLVTLGSKRRILERAKSSIVGARGRRVKNSTVRCLGTSEVRVSAVEELRD
jgi:hypothetical protein